MLEEVVVVVMLHRVSVDTVQVCKGTSLVAPNLHTSHVLGSKNATLESKN